MKKESLTNQVMKNSFWNFLMVLISKFGALFFVVIIARALLPERFGIYTLAMSITLILASFSDVGINKTLIRYVSEAIGKKDKELAKARYKFLLKLKFILTFLFSLILVSLSYPLSFYVFKKPELFMPLIFSGIYLIVYSLESFYRSIFYILKKVKYLPIKQALFETLRVIMILLLFVFISSKYYVLGVISSLIFSLGAGILFLLYYLKKLSPFLFEESKKKIEKKGILKFLFYLSIIGSFSIIFGYVDTVMLGIFLNSEFVGFYAVALTISIGFGSLLNISNILMPVFTQLSSKKTGPAFNKVFRYLCILTLPLVFGIFILGKYLIRFIYGYEYLPAVLPLYFLAFLIFEAPLIGILNSLFFSKGKPKDDLKVLVLATIINILLNYFLISSLLNLSEIWAMGGAAIATLFSKSLYLGGLIIYAKKRFDICLNINHFLKPLLASTIMAAILFLINFNLSSFNIAIGIIEIIFGAIIYFSVMLLIKGISKEDLLLKNLF